MNPTEAKAMSKLLRSALLALLLATSALGTPASGEESPTARQAFAEGMEILQDGKARKALRHFREADAEAGGSSFLLAWGTARAANDAGKEGEAWEAAVRALGLAENEGDRVLVRFELAFAGVGDPEKRDDVETALRSARANLEQMPNGLRTGLRFRICDTRRKLPDDSPLSLRHTLHEIWKVPSPHEGVVDGVTRQTEPLPGSTGAPHPESPLPVPAFRALRRSPPRTILRGAAEIRGMVDGDGCPTALRVVDAEDPEAAREVLSEVGDWVFEPVRIDGVTYATDYRLVLGFEDLR